MKTRGNKILALVMAVGMLASMSCTAFAATDIGTAGGAGDSEVLLTVEEGAMFNVTVPMNLAISVDKNGDVTVADNAKVVNLSHGQVQVTNVEIAGANGWSTVDFDTDMTKEKVGTKKLGFKINNDVTTSDGSLSFTQANFPVMDGANDSDSDEMAITYDAKLPAQKTAIEGSKVADVTFTVDWYEAE